MSELYHYGVLGMKWGVRKDREKGRGGGFGKETKTGSGKLPMNIIDPSDKKSWQAIYDSLEKDKDRQKGFAVFLSYNSHLQGSMGSGSRENYLDFVNDLKNGSSKRDPNLDKALNGGTLDLQSKHMRLMTLATKNNLSESEREELVTLSDEMEQLMSYYVHYYAQTETEEEQEQRKKREEYLKRANEAMEKIFADRDIMQNLHPYAKIFAEPHDDGSVSYIYTDPRGIETSYSSREKSIEKMRAEIKKDSNKTHLSTKFGRSREKSTSNSKPVSIKKGESLTVNKLKQMSEKERQDLNKLIEEAMKKKAGR